jgi:hypothetical protein
MLNLFLLPFFSEIPSPPSVNGDWKKIPPFHPPVNFDKSHGAGRREHTVRMFCQTLQLLSKIKSAHPLISSPLEGEDKGEGDGTGDHPHPSPLPPAGEGNVVTSAIRP